MAPVAWMAVLGCACPELPELLESMTISIATLIVASCYWPWLASACFSASPKSNLGELGWTDFPSKNHISIGLLIDWPLLWL